MLKGIDISDWNNPSNVRYYDYDFIIVKTSEGNFMKMDYWKAHVNNVQRAGKLLGLYHYCRPDLGNSAEAEATAWVNLIKPYIGKAVLALDYEGASLPYGASYALRFLNKVKALTGVKPLLYIQASAIWNGAYNSVRDAGYGLWLAQYNRTADYQPWPMYTIWQYSSSNYLDKNYFDGDASKWARLAGGSSDQKPVTPTKSVDELAHEVIDGKWGNGKDREEALTKAGYNYDAVQNRVNEILWNDQKIKVGDKVTPTTRYDANGNRCDVWVTRAVFTVSAIDGNRAQLSRTNGITGWWKLADLKKV